MSVYADRITQRGRQKSLRVRQEQARMRAVQLAPIFAEVQAAGAVTLQAIVTALNARGVTTARGGSWSAAQVSRVLARIVDERRAGPLPGPEIRPASDTGRAAADWCNTKPMIAR